MESLSDHLYIEFNIHTIEPEILPNRSVQRKWNNKKLDEDLFTAVLIWRGGGPKPEEQGDINKMVNWLDRTMEEACDATSLRVGPKKPRQKAYWWQDSVDHLRTDCLHARRL